MSQIKLKHSGGNSVIIAAPDSNPASDRTLKLPSDGDGTILTTNSPTGKLLQVVQTVKTSKQSVQSQTLVDISGFELTITPSSASNKILLSTTITACCHASGVFNLWRQIGSNSYSQLDTFKGDADGNRLRVTMHMGQTQDANTSERSMIVLDSPNTTDTVKYKWQTGTPYHSSYVIVINSSIADTNNNYYTRSISTITAMEIAA